MNFNDNALAYFNKPTESKLKKMNSYELFEIANRSSQFREEMVKFILNQKIKPVVSPLEKYDVKKIGLTERLKNALLGGDFPYLTDVTVVKKSDLMLLRGFGKKCFDELMVVMDKYGLKLVQE
jgi:DNA-directed RNA polymerase alpha subunit